MAIIQVRVDEKLKKEASELYEKLGLDLSSAIRMFLSRSVMENGIPFSMYLKKEKKETEELLDKLRQEAKVNGASNMSLNEVNDIIASARKDRKKK